MVVIAFLTFPAWVEISPICFQFLPFLSVIALVLVGIYPRYLGQDRVTHIVGASIAGILSVVWNIVSGILLIPALLLIVLILIFAFNIRDKLFWIECLAFLNIYSSNCSAISKGCSESLRVSLSIMPLFNSVKEAFLELNFFFKNS